MEKRQGVMLHKVWSFLCQYSVPIKRAVAAAAEIRNNRPTFLSATNAMLIINLGMIFPSHTPLKKEQSKLY